MRTTALPATLALSISISLALGLAGCATRQSMDADYDKSLGPWQGATEEALRARWGKPASEQQDGQGKWLTYVVDTPLPPGGGTRVGISIGGFGLGGGRTSVGGGVGVSAPLGSLGGGEPKPDANTCTTRFLIENGKVSTWNFDGPACGRVQ
jgi:hypothetical protein